MTRRQLLKGLLGAAALPLLPKLAAEEPIKPVEPIKSGYLPQRHARAGEVDCFRGRTLVGSHCIETGLEKTRVYFMGRDGKIHMYEHLYTPTP